VSIRATLDGAPADPDRVRTLALVNLGHFTTMRVEDRGVRGLGLHLERLVRDCARVLEADLDAERVRRYLRDALDGVPRPVAARVTVFDPGLDLGGLAADATPSVLVTLRPAGATTGPGLRLRAAVYQRELPEVKHTALFGAIRLRRAAQRAGADDVLFVGPNGEVCETSIASIGFLDGDRVVWPRADWLPGVTMRLIDQVAPSDTRPLTLADLGALDGAFIANAGIGVRPVTAVDGVEFPADPPLLHRLRTGYESIDPEPV
jgi:branched-subunit amino acid aminotransferase/4-amino-4-deoxychorismate lyase